MARWQLTLYVSGSSQRSATAWRNLRAVLDEEFPESFDVSVVDVVKDPAVAESARILATPTLVRETGGATSRIIGDLGDRARLAQWLRGLPLESERASEDWPKSGADE